MPERQAVAPPGLLSNPRSSPGHSVAVLRRVRWGELFFAVLQGVFLGLGFCGVGFVGLRMGICGFQWFPRGPAFASRLTL